MKAHIWEYLLIIETEVFFFEILTKPKLFTQKHDVITIACLLFYSIFQCLTWWAVAFFFFLDMVDWPISSFSTNYKPYHEFHLFHFSKTWLKNPHQHDCYPNILQIDTPQIIIHRHVLIPGGLGCLHLLKNRTCIYFYWILAVLCYWTNILVTCIQKVQWLFECHVYIDSIYTNIERHLLQNDTH